MDINTLRNMVFDEYSALLHLDKIFDHNNLDITNRIDKFGMLEIGEFNQPVHLPTLNEHSMGFSIMDWRLNQGFPDIAEYISEEYIIKLKESYQLSISYKQDKEPDYAKILSLLDYIEYWSSIEDKVSIRFIAKPINTCCVELPIQQKSVILCSKDDSYQEHVLYLIHEIGHAIVNYYKHQRGWLFSIEVDEFFAHLFEFLIIRDLMGLLDLSQRQLFEMTYSKYNLERLRNSIIYTKSLIDYLGSAECPKERIRAINDVLIENASLAGIEEKVKNKVLSRNTIGPVLNYLCYSATYIYPQHIIRNLEKHEKLNIKTSDLIELMEKTNEGASIEFCGNMITQICALEI